MNLERLGYNEEVALGIADLTLMLALAAEGWPIIKEALLLHTSRLPIEYFVVYLLVYVLVAWR